MDRGQQGAGAQADTLIAGVDVPTPYLAMHTGYAAHAWHIAGLFAATPHVRAVHAAC
jgi:hypothetical protein